MKTEGGDGEEEKACQREKRWGGNIGERPAEGSDGRRWSGVFF